MRTAPVALATLALSLGCTAPGSTGTLVNATPYTIAYSLTFQEFVDSSLVTLQPGGRATPWTSWPDNLFIERGIDGADPLSFSLQSLPPIGAENVLLVLSNYTLYLVPSTTWPQSLPQSESEVQALAVFKLRPLH